MASVEAVQRRRAARRAKQQYRAWREHHINKSARLSVLSPKVIQRIDGYIRQMENIGQIDLDVLDYRFWECIRCRFNPRRAAIRILPDGSRVEARLIDWWRDQTWRDRNELVNLSRMTDRPRPDFSERRIKLWAKVRSM